MNHYRTRDLGEAAALITSGCKMLDIEREDTVCFFVFSDEVKCKELAQEYFFGDLQVRARSFYDCMKRLKFKIHN